MKLLTGKAEISVKDVNPVSRPICDPAVVEILNAWKGIAQVRLNIGVAW